MPTQIILPRPNPVILSEAKNPCISLQDAKVRTFRIAKSGMKTLLLTAKQIPIRTSLSHST